LSEDEVIGPTGGATIVVFFAERILFGLCLSADDVIVAVGASTIFNGILKETGELIARLPTYCEEVGKSTVERLGEDEEEDEEEDDDKGSRCCVSIWPCFCISTLVNNAGVFP
jgi:hypothetical protein